MDQGQTRDVAVVGGGLAGLAAAALLARRGHPVVLFERTATLGGRAVTHAAGGFRLNLGPHALYRRGPGAAVLDTLGVRYTGGVPDASGGLALDGGAAHALPGGLVSLLTTGLFGPVAKLETARLLGGFQRLDAERHRRRSVRDYLDASIRHPAVRRLVQALFRLATYTNDPEHQSAGVAIAQLQLALRTSVTYLDGGWQTLVDGLRAAAEASGVRIATGAPVSGIVHDGAVRGVRLRDGTTVPARAAVIAAAPVTALELLGDTALPAFRERLGALVPVKAACLDVALGHLPRAKTRFALGIDRPLYYSVHSAVARLAPAGGAVVHVAKYVAAGEPGDPKANERELEDVLDRLQPGWRAAVVERRFLPALVVSHATVTAAAGGLAGRPAPAVPGVERLYVAGDWVGAEGLLADASLASARQVADLIGATGLAPAPAVA